MKFKVGDRIITTCFDKGRNSAGIITGIDHNFRYLINFPDDARAIGYNDNELELVPDIMKNCPEYLKANEKQI